MKRFLSLLLVGVLLCCLVGCSEKPTTEPSPPETGKTPLVIMSFNIQTHKNGEVFYVREEMMQKFIAEMQPDSIGMQEVTATWRKSLESTCFGENYSAVGNASSSTGEMNSIFYRNDKFSLVDSGTFWLSPTPEVVGSKFENSNEARVCTWAHLKDKKTAKEFVHLNVHLDNTGPSTAADATTVRLEQGKVLLDFVKTLGDTPLILTGDFNQVQQRSTGEAYPLYLYLTGQDSYTDKDGNTVSGPFADARMTAPDTVPQTEWASMVKHHRDGGNPASRPIDYIFYSAEHFEATTYRNILYMEEDIFTISDHLAQYAELLL